MALIQPLRLNLENIEQDEEETQEEKEAAEEEERRGVPNVALFL